jgi:hypothetical protein
MRLRHILVFLVLVGGLFLAGCSTPEPKRPLTASEWIAQPRPGTTKEP